MTQNILPVSLLALGSAMAPAAVLFQDNFNAPDTGNLDLSDQSGRRSGLEPNIQVRSSRVQHGIAGTQLNFLSARTGRIRFHEDTDNDTSTGEIWNDWASGTTGANIIGSTGLRVELDWIAGNDTSTNWISVNLGINSEGAGEPGFRVNDAGTDIGMLLRFNGDSELFDNGVNLGAQGSFTPTIGLRHVTLDYTFDSFADGTNVNLVANVDGTEIYNDNPFTWSGNNGELYLELGTLENTLIDNVTISNIPVPEPSSSILALVGALGLIRRRR